MFWSINKSKKALNYGISSKIAFLDLERAKILQGPIETTQGPRTMKKFSFLWNDRISKPNGRNQNFWFISNKKVGQTKPGAVPLFCFRQYGFQMQRILAGEFTFFISLMFLTNRPFKTKKMLQGGKPPLRWLTIRPALYA